MALEINQIINSSLKVKSPKKRITGPYKVIAVSPKECWIIVALDYDNNPCFGLRWFNTKRGYPNSFGYKTWIILPKKISTSIIKHFKFDTETKVKLQKFIDGDISGDVIKNIKELVIDEV